MRKFRSKELNFWPSVSDLFLGFFLVAIFLWFSQVLSRVAEQTKIERNQVDAGAIVQNLADAKKRISELEELIIELKGQLAEKERLLNDKPPVIPITENEQFYFKSGSATLSSAFKKHLEEEKFPIILEQLEKFGSRVDTLEIVGHTDSEKLKDEDGNLDDDELLLLVLHGQRSASVLKPSSNTDLGIMRALEIRSLLQPWLASHSRSDIQIRCYSAGPTLLADGSLPPVSSGNDNQEWRRGKNQERRRIEILFLGLRTKQPGH
jgi:hypothetical protein